MRISVIKKCGWLELLGCIQYNLLKTVPLKFRPLSFGVLWPHAHANRSGKRLNGGKWQRVVEFLIPPRGHSRNWPKGGRNSPQCYTSTRFADHFSQKPLQGAFSAVFCTKLCLINRVRFVWRHKIAKFLSKNSFRTGQRVVSRPPRPIARMAPAKNMMIFGFLVLRAFQRYIVWMISQQNFSAATIQ